MKKALIVSLIINILFICGISVYATIYYDASQINYKTTTLDHAIDDLYTIQNTTVTNLEGQVTTLNNKLKSISIPLRVGANSKTTYSQADLGGTGIGTLLNTYSYFKISNFGKSNNGNTCNITAFLRSTNNWVNILENTEYNLSLYSNIGLKAYSYADNSWANCYMTIDIYNK